LGNDGTIMITLLDKLSNKTYYFYEVYALKMRWRELVDGMSDKIFSDTKQAWIDMLRHEQKLIQDPKELNDTLNYMMSYLDHRCLSKNISHHQETSSILTHKKSMRI